MGTAGIIVPLVNDASQARHIVQAAKFPPLGERSYGGRRLIDRQGRGYAEQANHEILLIAQIETPAALRKVDEIAAVAGIDALFYGGDDLMLRQGAKMTGARRKDDTAAELAIVANACRKHGKLAVNGSFSAEMITLSQSYGYNLIVSGADSAFLAASSKQASEQARRTLAAAASVIPNGAAPIRSSAY
jgi:4-hydroxy-2-oxoheptanedioate aldolase